MPNDREAVVIRPEEGLIYVFDLLKQKITTFKHYFFTDVSCQCYLDFFSDTKYLCIHENGDNDTYKMNLTYYEWPLTTNINSKGEERPPTIFAQFCGESEHWDPSYQVRKVNAHSMYVWCQSRHKEFF